MYKNIVQLHHRFLHLFLVAVLLLSQLLPGLANAISGETNYTGSNTGLFGDDNSVGPINLGFNFDFYGSTYSSTYVNINGTLNFDSAFSAYSNYALPYGSAPHSIMAFWDDIITRDFSDQSILYKTIGTPGSREFIVQ